MNNKIGLVDESFDPSHKALQHCEASAGSAFEFKFSIGLSQSVYVNGARVEGMSPGICPDEIIYFNDKEHFKTLTPLAGSIEVARDTIEDADSNFEQTDAGLIKWTKEVGIKMQYDSAYLAALRNIVQTDSIGGYGGNLIKAYSNGGFHLKIEIVNSAEGYTLQELVLNAKSGNFVDLYSQIEDDTEFTQTFLIEYSPYYVLSGNVRKALGVPFDATMTTTQTLEGLNLTLNATVTSEYEAITKNVYYQVIDLGKGEVATMAGVLTAGEDKTINLTEAPLGELKIQYMFTFEQAQLLIPGTTVTLVEAPGVLRNKEATPTVAKTTKK